VILNLFIKTYIVIIVIIHKNIRLFSPFACAITKVTFNTHECTSRNVRRPITPCLL